MRKTYECGGMWCTSSSIGLITVSLFYICPLWHSIPSSIEDELILIWIQSHKHLVGGMKIVILKLVPVLLVFSHEVFVPLSGIDLGDIQASLWVEIFHENYLVEVVAAPIDLSNVRQSLVNPVCFGKVLLSILEQRSQLLCVLAKVNVGKLIRAELDTAEQERLLDNVVVVTAEDPWLDASSELLQREKLADF